MRWLTILVLFGALIPACAGGSAHIPSASPTSESSAGAEGESITNVQEQGVDEGGIVKMHGEHLVVLRRGRLFSVDLADASMRVVSILDVSAPGHHPADWYDEMLIHDDTIVVIGFSYRDSATELGLFHVDAGGNLSHRATFQLRSNDYYSSRNYASRLVDDRLVLYIPHRLGSAERTSYPALREVGHEWAEIRGPARAANPTDMRGSSVLHTVVMCELGGDALGCRAQGMIGGEGRSFYVSRDAVYVWIAERSSHDGRPSDAAVFRMPLAGGETGAVRAWGMPTDQLSFEEDGATLHVLVRSHGVGDGMWGAERGATPLALASIPLASFGAVAQQVDPATYTPLPALGSDAPLQNRFVGEYVLYGGGDSWGFWGQRTEGALYAHPFRRGGATTRIEVGHGIERIEAMGRAAVAIGSEDGDLSFSSIALEGGPAIVDRVIMPGASQGETRTHGFFYRNDGEDLGVLGLPIRGGGAPGWAQLRHGSASVQFLRVRSARFSSLGGLAASDEGSVDDRCVASCADWYGNARPIFWRGRVFALLGYELVEGRMGRSGLEETARLSLWNREIAFGR